MRWKEKASKGKLAEATCPRRSRFSSLWRDEDEPLLEEDQVYPLGFKLPSLPDFPIDPLLEQHVGPFLNVRVEFILGV
jgi:hypothetical protein